MIKSFTLSKEEETVTIDDISVFREIKLIIFYGNSGNTYPMCECTVPYKMFKVSGGIMCRLVKSNQTDEYSRAIYHSDTLIECKGCNDTNKCALYGVY